MGASAGIFVQENEFGIQQSNKWRPFVKKAKIGVNARNSLIRKKV
jgi:hypothetical protein